MNEPLKISRSDVIKLIKQNQEMRKLLNEWPARNIMTDYEKDWNEKRIQFLSINSDLINGNKS